MTLRFDARVVVVVVVLLLYRSVSVGLSYACPRLVCSVGLLLFLWCSYVVVVVAAAVVVVAVAWFAVVLRVQ